MASWINREYQILEAEQQLPEPSGVSSPWPPFFQGPRGPCISSRGRAADLPRLDASPVLTLGATMVLYPMISSLEVRGEVRKLMIRLR